jgi:hypothetical protein
VIQIPIIILTSIGLLQKYTKSLLISIVLLDLLFIFLNYINRFVFYDQVIQLIGQNATEIIKKVALFLGFSMDFTDDLKTVLALNVVIFYFSC